MGDCNLRAAYRSRLPHARERAPCRLCVRLVPECWSSFDQPAFALHPLPLAVGVSLSNWQSVVNQSKHALGLDRFIFGTHMPAPHG